MFDFGFIFYILTTRGTKEAQRALIFYFMTFFTFLVHNVSQSSHYVAQYLNLDNARWFIDFYPLGAQRRHKGHYFFIL
jgi:hypothetical protein